MKNRHKQAIDNKKRKPLSPQMWHRLREGFFLISVACAVFLLISLVTYHTSDPGWSSTGLGRKVVNWGGYVGAWMADVFLSLFGVVAYFFPFLIILSSWLSVQACEGTQKKPYEWVFKLIGWLFLVASCCGLVNFYFQIKSHLPTGSGGIMGDLLGYGLSLLFNKTGSTLLFTTTLLCGITLVTGLSWLWVIETIGARVYQFWGHLREYHKQLTVKVTTKIEPVVEEKKFKTREESIIVERTMLPPIPKPVIVPKIEPVKEKKKIEIDSSIKLAPGTLPPFTLLNPTSSATEKPFSSISFEELSQLVEQRLFDFGVEVKVVAVLPGPIITRFELDLAPGIKVSKITGLAKDIARSLSAVSVRVVEVVPGKSVIALEIPNENRELVTLRDIVESQRYAQARSPVSLVLGKDISGHPVVVDLAKMPHLLVAGTTGSGKSVSLNAMLLSMLFKATPEQLRFIMIDPKMLELSVYDGIPHLLTPVITDMKDAANALRWCVAEMDKRYRLMASVGVRNISGYNQKVSDAIKQGQPIPIPGILVTDEETAKIHLEPLPIIVVIVDELADMMMVVGKKVEDLIARIAQKARAAGIHLIIATQRPSVDVITGLIKANIPTRVAFQVSSRIDSRTILDQQGAEQLLGHGDMLYLPPGAGVPVRVHGAYVADEEVHRVVAAWRSGGTPDYLYTVTDEISDTGGSADGNGSGEVDPLYDEAVRIITESRRASISLVQRRLRIGYNRAARIMEEMEVAGIVSSMDNSGIREVLAAAPPLD
ncbi:MAG: DNA translocase FtsK 4TM domain-containing protein [Gammaproteobacteria bacterium]|nr:DNA translocase FtsK 4TM domain-containing protein [Gammaproteobacteria bacterium]MCW5582809.1 DNA translocase FtsK 4TM domain-containing protein [Gammaproteobacteria bacterium]